MQPDNERRSNSPLETPATTERQRRERKRQTDRVAQREHRKRQKLYIEQLEAQLKILKSSDQSETTRLAVENFRMREEISQMRVLWDEMETLLQKQRKIREESFLRDPILEVSGPQTDYQGELPFPAAEQVIESRDADVRHESEDSILAAEPETVDMVPNSLDDQVNVFDAENADMDSMPVDLPHLNTLEGANDSLQMHVPFDISLWPELDQTASLLSQAYGLPSSRPPRSQHLHQHNSFSAQALDQMALIDTTQHASDDATDQALQIPRARHTVEAIDLFAQFLDSYSHHPPLSPSVWLPGASKTSEALPMLLFPPLPGDKHVHAILERARENIEFIGAPNVVDFLIDNPKNTLSVDLKAFLSPVRHYRRMSEFFATYWILYLLLRWQIKRDDETYQSLPNWMRPTPLQLGVLHPLAADLIAWPQMREALIHMSISDQQSVYDVSLDVGKYLTVDIQVRDSDLANPHQISAQISNLANWKLDREFFRRYPQWKGSIRETHNEEVGA